MVIPAILEYDSLQADLRIRKALEFSDTLHFDFIDESFGQPSFCTPEFLMRYTPHAFFELHMMVTDPLIHINPFMQAGVKRFIGHVEHMTDPLAFAHEVKRVEQEVFLGIDYDTPIEAFLENTELMNLVDGFTIMTIRAGASGQSFESMLLEKVKKVRARLAATAIEVDGGMNLDTAKLAKDAGANLFCTNSYLFKSENPKEAFEAMTAALS